MCLPATSMTVASFGAASFSPMAAIFPSRNKTSVAARSAPLTVWTVALRSSTAPAGRAAGMESEARTTATASASARKSLLERMGGAVDGVGAVVIEGLELVRARVLESFEHTQHGRRR